MNTNAVYAQIIAYATAHNLNFGVIKDEEICPECDFNGFSFVDMETLEIPCTFMVDMGLVLCIKTPTDMTPEDTGKSYGKYWDVVTDLNRIGKPQYVALDGAYVKLMCWCDWTGGNE